MSVLGRVPRLTVGDRTRWLDIQKELGVQSLLLHVERSQLRCFGHLIRIPPGGVPLGVLWQCGGDPGANPEHARGIICPIWPVNVPGPLWSSWRKDIWATWLSHRDSDLDKQQKMNGWMNDLLYCVTLHRCCFYCIHTLYNALWATHSCASWP